MRNVRFLIVPFLLLIVLVIVVAAETPLEAGLPASVETRLEQYLASPHATGQPAVVATAESRQPWLFSREMSDMVLGDSVYFQTDSPLTWKEGGGPSPLPFPAKEVWCALLKEANTSGKARYRLLFVALHMDMYSGDWMVHLGPESDSFSKAAERAAITGCALAE